MILHAGDVCVASVLEELSAYAPVHAVVGNNDGPDVSAWGARETAELDLAGLRVGMIHDAGAEGGSAGAASPPVPRDRPRRLRSLAYPAASNRRQFPDLQSRLAYRQTAPAPSDPRRPGDRVRSPHPRGDCHPPLTEDPPRRAAYTGAMEPGTDYVALLHRWEDAGGVWRVLGQDRDAFTVGLYRCDDGEEADRFVATDPQLAQFLLGRTSSQDQPDHEPHDRDRDSAGRARQARPRDRLGRPLPYGSVGVEPVSEEPLPPMETISYAHELLIKGRPFSAHEVYEARWKAGPDSERELWQGLAQLCVGITHAERGNRIGALRLVGRARRRLETYATAGGPAYGLDLDHIIEWIRNRESEPEASSWLGDQPL